jgi:uncharacterized protein YbcI
MRSGMSGAHAEQYPTAGSISASISNAVVRLMSEYTGRGATKARTHLHDDLVTVVLRDTLTKGEISLVSDGKGDLVLQMRHAYQATMREDLVAAVEMLTGRTVTAFLSANHIDPDIAIESFVLEPRPVDDPPAADAS